MFALFLGSWNNNRIFTILTYSNVLIYSCHVGHYFQDFMSYTSLLRRRQWNPLQYSCLENPMDGGAWWAAAHEVTKSQTQLSD